MAQKVVIATQQYALDQRKIAEGCIRSLQLLGYSPELYPLLNGSQLTYKSFDNTNEKHLLCLLHFLLNKLDDDFAEGITSCWPFYETREKNEFKRIAHSRMSKVFLMKGTTILDHSDCRASLLSVAKGSAMWAIVRKLSDAALDKASMEAGVPVLENDSQPDSIMRQGTVPAVDLLAAIQKELRSLIAEAIETRYRQRQQAQYASELDNRMKLASKMVVQSKTNMELLSKSGDIQYLSENARLSRSEMVLRIREAQQQLCELRLAGVHDDAIEVSDTYTPNLAPSSKVGGATGKRYSATASVGYSKAKASTSSSGYSANNKSSWSSTSASNNNNTTIRKKPSSHILSLEELEPLITFLEQYADSSSSVSTTASAATTTTYATSSDAALSSRALQRLLEQSEAIAEALKEAKGQSVKLVKDSTARVMRT